jgi:LPXTG-motif cell wall-anchored protein
MRHLPLLAAIYALIAALVLPGSLLASEDAGPAPADTPATETAAAQEPPVAPPEQAETTEPAEPAPAPEQPVAAPEQAGPAPSAAAPSAPAEPAPGEAPERPKAEPKAVAAASGSVAIADFSFTPAQITIDQGDTVTWTNNGPTPHSATAPDGSFDTGIFPAGQSRSHTFSAAGTFSYICTPHPNMRGTVVVRASQNGGETPDTTSGETGSGDTSGSTGTDSSGAETAQAEEGPSLPNTGTDTTALVLLGALMLLVGAAVHRRARTEQPRPAGRIGW